MGSKHRHKTFSKKKTFSKPKIQVQEIKKWRKKKQSSNCQQICWQIFSIPPTFFLFFFSTILQLNLKTFKNLDKNLLIDGKNNWRKLRKSWPLFSFPLPFRWSIHALVVLIFRGWRLQTQRNSSSSTDYLQQYKYLFLHHRFFKF